MSSCQNNYVFLNIREKYSYTFKKFFWYPGWFSVLGTITFIERANSLACLVKRAGAVKVLASNFRINFQWISVICEYLPYHYLFNFIYILCECFHIIKLSNKKYLNFISLFITVIIYIVLSFFLLLFFGRFCQQQIELLIV